MTSYRNCVALGVPVLIFWGGNYYASTLPDSTCWLVWDKRDGTASDDHADGELAWTNQTTPVRIFHHLWRGMIKASERNERRVHPTQKPVALAEWCMNLYGEAGDNVLDLFGGSGWTVIAAERTGRTAFVMEMSEAYCDVIRRRYAAFVGDPSLEP
jgi:site-specific DNA-methyltransferase (adenine-specific)/modification methylase